ncbi:MAG: eukaryotic-like serine/threonine-protein kinase [Thermoplasmata archaeon]|jgi:hypothetical protein|nr:eukaryotic-like serine/threonine-protein kinase [Thermoplasmata archaeon]
MAGVDPRAVEAIAYLAAAAVQAALAGVLALRPRRKEWTGVLALLFAVNAVVCGYRGLILGPWQGAGAANPLVQIWLEPATSFLLAYLFLIHPSPPAWAEHRPWALRAAVFLPLAALWGVALAFPGFVEAVRPAGPWEDSLHLLYTDLFPALAWCVVLLRGAMSLRAATSLVRQQPLAILYAAVGVRAAHASLLQLLLRLTSRTLASPPGITALVLAALPVVALAAAFAVLLAWRRQAGGARTRHATLALGFLGFGCLLAFPFAGGTFNPDTGWPRFITHLDLYVLRPALVWVAVLPARAPRVALPLLAVFVAAGAGAATFTGFAGAFASPVPLAAFAVAVAALAAFAAWVLGGWGLGAWSPERLGRSGPAGIEAYLDALEEALRSGAGSPAQRRRLQAMRRDLGISPEQDEALRGAVQHAWREAPARREWEPTDRVLGRYAVLAELGEGGCGKAYLARDLLADEEVVLKRTTSLDPRARRALLVEAAALQRLASPRIVRHLRTEPWAGESVLVLQHMAGGSLADRLRAHGPLPLPEALRMAQDVLEGLAVAHAAGLVHCDLKPSNVLFGADGRAALADFGVSAPAPPAAGLLDATATALRPGSLRYMSPEQARGLPADARSDLHAVALTLLASLAGAHPLEGQGELEVRQAIAAGRVPVPAMLPAPLRRLLRSALAVDPAQRPASATEMLEALRRAAARAPTGPGTAAGFAPPRPRRLPKGPARRPAAAEPS